MACCGCPTVGRAGREPGTGDILIDSPFDLPYPAPVTAARFQPTWTRGAAAGARIGMEFAPQAAAPIVPLLVIAGVVGYLWYSSRKR